MEKEKYTPYIAEVTEHSITKKEAGYNQEGLIVQMTVQP
jgi:hypothetical protein